MNTIGFIGGGNMAKALIGGLLAADRVAGNILVAEPNRDAAEYLRDTFGVKVLSDNQQLVAEADVVVVAVKPQVVAEVVRGVAQVIASRQPLLVSIVAGIPVSAFTSWVGGSLAMVRTMPNTPALIGKGITALFANEQVTAAQREQAEQILTAAGRTLWVEQEQLLDAVTAVSGSGPAYFFRVIEAMIAAGEALGLSTAEATQLTIATAVGAAELAQASEQPVAELRRQVTSPGGTTAAALEVLEAGQIDDLFQRALTAAVQRAVELADEA